MVELRTWGTRVKGRGDSAYLTGLLSAILREHRPSKPLIWENYPKDENLHIDGIGNVKITKWVLERTSDNWLAGTSVVYVLNGQVHFKEKSNYLKHLKLYNLEGSLLVAVDVNKIPINVRDEIFRVDRTFLEETVEADLLKTAVEKAIKNDEELKKINDSKFAESISDIDVSQESSQKIIKKLAKEVPGLAELLKGSEIPMFAGGVTLKKVKGEKYKNTKFGLKSPTFFQPIKELKIHEEKSE